MEGLAHECQISDLGEKAIYYYLYIYDGLELVGHGFDTDKGGRNLIADLQRYHSNQLTAQSIAE